MNENITTLTNSALLAEGRNHAKNEIANRGLFDDTLDLMVECKNRYDSLMRAGCRQSWSFQRRRRPQLIRATIRARIRKPLRMELRP